MGIVRSHFLSGSEQKARFVLMFRHILCRNEDPFHVTNPSLRHRDVTRIGSFHPGQIIIGMGGPSADLLRGMNHPPVERELFKNCAAYNEF